MSLAGTINAGLGKLGYRIVRPRPTGWAVGDAGDRVSTLIDVGCAFGTPPFYAINPRAELFLIDALREYEPHMRDWLRTRAGRYEIVALGSGPGQVSLNVELDAPTKTSALPRTDSTRTAGRIAPRKVPQATLDALIDKYQPPAPFGLKIDVEGLEVEVLLGARATLERCDFVIVETSVQERFVGSCTLFDMLDHMNDRGFAVANVLSAEPDRAGQVRLVDLLFTKKAAAAARTTAPVHEIECPTR